MPTTLKNVSDNSIIHRNNYLTNDFNSDRLVEIHQDIDFPDAKGKLSQWIFDGTSIGHNTWTYKKYLETSIKADLDVVHMHFNLRGKITMEYSNFGKHFTIGSYQHNLFYANGFEGIIRNEELYSETFIIQLTKETFIRFAHSAGDKMARFGEKILEGKPIAMSEHNLYIGLLMHNAIKDILRCRYEDGIKKLYLQSKCLELLVLQAEAFEKSEITKPVYCKTEYDKERILFARDYLVQHADMPPGLDELSKIAGINSFKLKNGFKELFNNTVFGYLSDYRLEQAKNDLISGQKTATEIAFELGYSSLQHFSSAFKKKYGVSPKRKR
jgi:AraC-like DNA-binding protein